MNLACQSGKNLLDDQFYSKFLYREEYEEGRDFYHAVALIKKGKHKKLLQKMLTKICIILHKKLPSILLILIFLGSLPDVNSLSDLRGKHACFAGVGTQAGWTIPIFKARRPHSSPVHITLYSTSSANGVNVYVSHYCEMSWNIFEKSPTI